MMRSLVVVITTLAACSSPAVQEDAHLIGDGRCGVDLEFTGEYVDWTSNSAAGFCGIYNAMWQVHGDSTRTDQSNPNGRFELCVKQTDVTQVDITPPSMASQCVSGMYTKPGIAIANKAVMLTTATFSARSITDTELQQSGLNLDAAKGYVFVHVDGPQRAVSISSSHDASLAFDGTGWNPGDTGANVFFPNTDIADGTTMVQVAGGAVGTGSIPVVANTFTYVTVVTN